MGTFKSSKTFFASPALIPMVAQEIATSFANENYEVQTEELISGGYDISITKGNLFKAVLGMKTALKVNIFPQGNNIRIEAGVGIFGQQAVPTVISLFFFWPVIITQISGLISQSKIDDKVLEIAADTIQRESSQIHAVPANSAPGKFCTHCGKQLEGDAKFCSSCGNKL